MPFEVTEGNPTILNVELKPVNMPFRRKWLRNFMKTANKVNRYYPVDVGPQKGRVHLIRRILQVWRVTTIGFKENSNADD